MGTHRAPRDATHNSVWRRGAADEALDLPFLAVEGMLRLGAGDDGWPCKREERAAGISHGWLQYKAPVAMRGVLAGTPEPPFLRGRDGATAPSPPAMQEDAGWGLCFKALLVFCKAPSRLQGLCSPSPGVGRRLNHPAGISSVSLASEKGCLLRQQRKSLAHLVLLFHALPDSLSNRYTNCSPGA